MGIIGLDPHKRESQLAIKADDGTVAEALDGAIAAYGKPTSITCDHGTEFMPRLLEDWVYTRGVKLDFTRPWKPTDNRLHRVV